MIRPRRISKKLLHPLGVISGSLVLLMEHLIKRVGVTLYHLDVDNGLLVFGGLIDETAIFQQCRTAQHSPLKVSNRLNG